MDSSPPKVDFEVHRTKLDPRRTHVESVGVRRSPRRTWWIRLGSTQVESAAESILVQLEPRESASEPRGAAADSSLDITISLRSGELDAPRIILNIVRCGQVVS